MAIPNEPKVNIEKGAAENVVEEGNVLAPQKRSRVEDRTLKSVAKDGDLV